MLKSIRLMVLTVAALFLVGAGADVLYVQSSNAKVMSKASFKANVVTTVKKGDELEFVGATGSWYEVKVDGKTGFIRNLLVSKTPPIKKVSVFSGKESEDISSKARRRASVRTTAAAARGLAEDDRRRVGAESNVDYAAMEKIDAITVTEDEVNAFIEKAK